ncbi:hypothetical protein P8C59_000991 [Phyllachora maydis]|uniref:Uncharacterized protein n=1 Tax=Phyllachora maydis TaxID=1825666 RepID=A0AAD9MAX7_9PEZI|nr:hypothetical protein P8C59_000991 [Phyllachora maydis]
MSQDIWIYLFRGHPTDVYFNRHALIFVDSREDGTFHHTCHIQRDAAKTPWQHRYDLAADGETFLLDVRFLCAIHVATLRVDAKTPMVVVDRIRQTPILGDADASDWNCQDWVADSLKTLLKAGYVDRATHDGVFEAFMDAILDGALG